jgi:hypothetical protein
MGRDDPCPILLWRDMHRDYISRNETNPDLEQGSVAFGATYIHAIGLPPPMYPSPRPHRGATIHDLVRCRAKMPPRQIVFVGKGAAA